MLDPSLYSPGDKFRIEPPPGEAPNWQGKTFVLEKVHGGSRPALEGICEETGVEVTFAGELLEWLTPLVPVLAPTPCLCDVFTSGCTCGAITPYKAPR